jgi:hypothetical protein
MIIARMVHIFVGARIVRPQGTSPLSDFGMTVDTAINNISNYYANITVDKSLSST